MGKLKRMSSEIVSILALEPLTFNQILREFKNSDKEKIIDIIDIMINDEIIVKKDSQYHLTSKAHILFGGWD